MGYIKWKVENCEVHHPGPGCLPSLDVSLSGIIHNYGAYRSRRMTEVIEEIENNLNRDDKAREYKEYARCDIASTLEIDIKNVIFNDPATIVFWTDGSKTVVKCQEGDIYDPEKGLAMAIAKKSLGNKGNYCNVFKKWLPEDSSNNFVLNFDGGALKQAVAEYHQRLMDELRRRLTNDQT